MKITTLTKTSKPKEVQAAWVEALKSKKYQQGKFRLCLVNGEEKTYCCLGVLCDLAVKASVIPVPIHTERFSDTHRSVVYTCNLPPSVTRWAGLTRGHGPYYNSKGKVFSLSNDNDKSKSFSQIARTIRRKPKGLFRETGKDDHDNTQAA